MQDQDIVTTSINTIRTLSMDAVQAARSGHPGAAMAMAPVMYCLWNQCLRFDPENPTWPGRDRFVLSIGHASMLLYATLHLCGVRAIGDDGTTSGALAVSLDDIKQFRQLDSKCPGHPEYRLTSGVEMTTGPLGQGAATSVGMAIAGRWMSHTFNRPGFEMFNYNVYALCGDGDMMEGVSSEAASFAGHLRLPNLCWIYDSNRITIEGGTDLAFSEDVTKRFIAYGWQVIHVADANDIKAITGALQSFQHRSSRPTLIIVNSHIAYGAPNKQDTSAAHGEPLGEEEVRLTKRFYGWPEDAKFLVPDGVYKCFREGIGARGRALREQWTLKLDAYQIKYSVQAQQLRLMQEGQLPEGWDRSIPQFPADGKGLASREASGQVLNAIARHLPWLIGGAADLAPSTKTRLTFEGAGEFTAGETGRNLRFGVREHAMGAILNGLAISKMRAYGASFLIFSDYLRPSLRLSAIMNLPTIYIFTHDSIGVGEDGPTHQPIEQLASLRSIPGLITLRPADANEVIEAWRVIIRLQQTPAVLVLTRQNLPTLDRSRYAQASGLRQGGYVLADAPNGQPDILLLATGSEVALCIDAYEQLAKEGIHARVVSMPSLELFEAQVQTYRDAVLPPSVTARVAVERATTFGWDRYVGRRGHVIGMKTFGASAPEKLLAKRFGFTTEKVIEAAKAQIRIREHRVG